jgi:hypothetical protein
MNQQIIWQKSSYSDNGGLNCVEVGVWHKSSHSGDNGGDCVEVAPGERLIAVRDSKHPEGGKLAFSRSAWAAFTEKLKRDLPLS